MSLIFAVAAFVVAAVQPSPPVPPSDVGGAKPIKPTGWFSANDFPMIAVQQNHQGTVYVYLTIGTDGRVSECRLARSSGYADLDAVPCPVLQRRARFKPALDEQGQPKVTSGTYPVPFIMSGY